MFSITPTQILMKNIFQNALMVWVGNTHLICNKLNLLFPSKYCKKFKAQSWWFPGSFIRRTSILGLMLLESRRLRQQKIIRKFQAICLNMSRRLQLPEALHSARSVFLSLAGFWRTRERLCSSRVRYLLNIRRRLLGYGFEPRPVLATVGSPMSIGLSINGCSHSKITVWRERTRLTSPKVWAAVT